MSDDDDKTRVIPRETEVTNTLPPGWRLHEFELQRVIGEGGFGIVYLAHDTQLERRVAVKEYMPGALAARARDWSISVKSERHKDTFEAGMRSFINEAKLLARFDHPALVKVHRFWEAHGTAYMAMQFYEGPTLKDDLKARNGVPPDEAWLKQLLTPLLESLERLHAEQCYHRDIAPDNIILQGGIGTRPVLLDFGAARRIIGDLTQALTVILKPGYAPVEQYAEVPSLKQGPWTDVYALAAVLYYAINGRPPLPSVARMIKDDMKSAREIGEGRYSLAFLSAIDAGLAVLPDARPPTLSAFRELLFATPDVITQYGADEDSEKTRIGPRPVVQPLSGPGGLPPAPQPNTQTATRTPAPVPVKPGGSKGLVIAAIAIVVIAAAAGIGWKVMSGGTPAATPAGNTASTAPADTGTASNATLSATGPGTASTPTITTPPATAAIPTDASGWIDAVFQRRSAAVAVDASAEPARLKIGRDPLSFRVRSQVDGYVYVLFSGTRHTDLVLMFPNTLDGNNRITAGQELVLPRKGWNITADGPAGSDRIVVLVSPNKRDFKQPALVAGAPFSEFDVGALTRAGNIDAVSGRADCDGKPGCDTSYGAARFEIEEY
ncbi:hypothetical protein BH09PSE6_BH09PSE6_26240 [soil metagenome]